MAAVGNEIVVTPNPLGRYIWGVLSGTPKPGTCMEIVPGTARDGNGNLTYRVATTGGHGSRRTVLVLDRDKYQGGLAETAYTSGVVVVMYCPITGEELNVRKKDVSGTGSASEDIDEGDYLIIEAGTGLLMKSAQSGVTTIEATPFQAVEALVDPTSEALVWVMTTGV